MRRPHHYRRAHGRRRDPPHRRAVDTSKFRLLTVPFDGDVGVVVVVGWDPTTRERLVIEEATATEFADLAVEASRAYADVFVERSGAARTPA